MTVLRVYVTSVEGLILSSSSKGHSISRRRRSAHMRLVVNVQVFEMVDVKVDKHFFFFF